MSRWALAAAVLLAGCPLAYDDDDSAGGTAPIVSFSSPSSAVLTLGRADPIEFAARGDDPDSLDLTWRFEVDDGFEAGGDSADGAFDVSWTLAHRAGLAGQSIDVVFVVSDGRLETERRWVVDVEL